MDAVLEQVEGDLAVIDAALTRIRESSTDLLDPAARLEVAVRVETIARVVGGLSYRVIGEIVDPVDGPGPRGVKAKLARVLRVNRSEVDRRAKLAARIRPRRQVSGPALPPELPRLADAMAQGLVGEDHISAVVKALDGLPGWVSGPNRGWAEKKLVRHARRQDPGFVTAVGRAIADTLNPDGVFEEKDRAARRTVTLSRQGADGMSRISGFLTPAARAALEAVGAAVRPGHHVPNSDQTVVDAQADSRTAGQRLHDALEWGLSAGIASGALGTHRGLPVTVIARTTVQDLEQAVHAMVDPAVPMPPPARTGGGSSLPMRDLITAAAGSIHYLAVFDQHSDRPLYLGRSKRIASADLRIVCHARDGGCTRPGCTVAGYHAEVHHAPGWAAGGTTDADTAFFACGPDNQAEAHGDYTTHVTDTGRLAWSDGTGPPHINHLHHPHELLTDNDEDDP
jgi:hypothetical protein